MPTNNTVYAWVYSSQPIKLIGKFDMDCEKWYPYRDSARAEVDDYIKQKKGPLRFGLPNGHVSGDRPAGTLLDQNQLNTFNLKPDDMIFIESMDNHA